MSKKISEVSHAKNVSNFDKLIIVCISLETSYNPALAAILLTALQAKYTSSDNAVKAVNSLFATLKNDVNEREILFNKINKLCTRIINAVEASDVSEQFIKDVKAIIRKLKGKRAKPKMIDDPNTPEDESLQSISASQMSYDNRLNNFDILVKLLASMPTYIPNETNLTVASLTTFWGELDTANRTAKTTYTAIKTARISRNHILYHPKTGLVALSLIVKKYVVSAFGSQSPQHKELTALQFVRLAKRGS